MNTTKFFAVAALATIAAATSAGVFADTLRDSGAYAIQAGGNLTRAEVRASAIEQARNHEVRPYDYVAQTVQKGSDRAAVRAEAAQAVRLGRISAGEATYQ